MPKHGKANSNNEARIQSETANPSLTDEKKSLEINLIHKRQVFEKQIDQFGLDPGQSAPRSDLLELAAILAQGHDIQRNEQGTVILSDVIKARISPPSISLPSHVYSIIPGYMLNNALYARIKELKHQISIFEQALDYITEEYKSNRLETTLDEITVTYARHSVFDTEVITMVNLYHLTLQLEVFSESKPQHRLRIYEDESHAHSLSTVEQPMNPNYRFK